MLAQPLVHLGKAQMIVPEQKLNTLTACAAVDAIRNGRISSYALTEACIARINEYDRDVQAFAYVDELLARRTAAERDAQNNVGLLHGVPIAVKDVLDTADQPTEMGSPIYNNYMPRSDASVVRLLRNAGAVILGKTITAEFAAMTPPPTANPLNLEHTAGASSSGSAAAVAAEMVPLAIGTQTGGSVLRPASYCGVVGFKPSFGRFCRVGMKINSESLDTLGWMARSVEDVALLDRALSGKIADRSTSPSLPRRAALCRTGLWEAANPEAREAVLLTVKALRSHGVHVVEIDLPNEADRIKHVHHIILSYERARALADELARFPELLGPALRQSIDRGLAIEHHEYLDALKEASLMRAKLAALTHDIEFLITPCVDGEAPVGHRYTGNPSYQSMWTLLHVPALGLPVHRGPTGLPVSVQLVGRLYDDEALLSHAQAVSLMLADSSVRT